jgi:hypothetical protein
MMFLLHILAQAALVLLTLALIVFMLGFDGRHSGDDRAEEEGSGSMKSITKWLAFRLGIYASVAGASVLLFTVGAWLWTHRCDPPIICWNPDGSHRDCTAIDAAAKAARRNQ